LIEIASLVVLFFQCFGMLQVCAEISLRKWSGGTAQLRTLEGALIAKNALCWQQCFILTHVSLHMV